MRFHLQLITFIVVLLLGVTNGLRATTVPHDQDVDEESHDYSSGLYKDHASLEYFDRPNWEDSELDKSIGLDLDERSHNNNAHYLDRRVSKAKKAKAGEHSRKAHAAQDKFHKVHDKYHAATNENKKKMHLKTAGRLANSVAHHRQQAHNIRGGNDQGHQNHIDIWRNCKNQIKKTKTMCEGMPH